jgi:hypothetical protein
VRHKRINPGKALAADACPAFLARFFAKIRVSTTRSYRGTFCWEWTGHRDPNGYPQVKFQGKTHWAHRVSCAMFRKKLAAGEEADHACHNPCCVNPRHVRPMAMPANRANGHGRKVIAVEEGAPF